MQQIDLFPDILPMGTKIALGPEPSIHPTGILVDCRVSGWTEIGPGTHMAESDFGDYSYCAGDNQIIYTTIGKFCSIASHVRINPGNHPMGRVTQHHMTYRRSQYGFGPDDTAFFDWRQSNRCMIGHDVWVGHGAIIMPGVSVGTGAVIGSGAVVTHDVPPYTVAVGVPARPIRLRFREDVVAALLRVAWWDWDRATLEARFDDLLDVEGFVRTYG
jgi:hypothetical protein